MIVSYFFLSDTKQKKNIVKILKNVVTSQKLWTFKLNSLESSQSCVAKSENVPFGEQRKAFLILFLVSKTILKLQTDFLFIDIFFDKYIPMLYHNVTK